MMGTQTRNSGSHLPPHDLDAERSLLGALLLGREAIAEVADKVTPDDFYSPLHADVFEAVLKLWRVGDPADAVTVSAALMNQERYIDRNVRGDLMAFQAETPSVSNAATYAKVIRDLSDARRVLVAHRRGVERLMSGQTVDEVTERTESELRAIADARSSGETDSLEDLAHRHLDRLEALAEGKTIGSPTGFPDLDKKLKGLRPGAMYTIAGRPGMGKSTLAQNLATNIALGEGKPVLIFTLEMASLDLYGRIIGATALVDTATLDTGNLSDDDWKRYHEATTKVVDATIEICDDASPSITEIRAKARRVLSEQGELGLIVVDYIQLMSSAGAENRQAEVARISRELKVLAQDLQVPVIAVAQLNRSVEQRIEKRPTMADIRESGAIENDSDVVLLVYRDEFYDENSPDRGVAEVIVGKNRWGAQGTVRMAFRGKYLRFDSLVNGVRAPKPGSLQASSGLTVMNGGAW